MWISLIVAWLFYLYEYILRAFPSVITQDLMSHFTISSTMLGVMSSFYYLAYVPLQIPCGLIVDRIGPKLVIGLSSLLCVIGCILFTSSSDMIVAQGGRFLMGMGSACAYMSCAKIGSFFKNPSMFAIISGVTMFMGTLGGSFGGKPFAMLAHHTSWVHALHVLSFAGLIIGMISLVLIKNQHRSSASFHILKDLKMIVRKKDNWLIGLYGCMMYLPLCVFAELWGIPFLMKKFHIDNQVAANAGIMVLVGMGIGSMIAPFISEHLRSRLKVMTWSCFLTVGLLVVVIYGTITNFYVNCFILLMMGIISGGQILYFTAVKEHSPPEASATAVAFTNSLVMASALVIPPIIGWALDRVSSGDMEITSHGSIRLYTCHDFQLSFIIMIVLMIVGGMLLKFAKEPYNPHEKA